MYACQAENWFATSTVKKISLTVTFTLYEMETGISE